MSPGQGVISQPGPEAARELEIVSWAAAPGHGTNACIGLTNRAAKLEAAPGLRTSPRCVDGVP